MFLINFNNIIELSFIQRVNVLILLDSGWCRDMLFDNFYYLLEVIIRVLMIIESIC